MAGVAARGAPQPPEYMRNSGLKEVKPLAYCASQGLLPHPTRVRGSRLSYPFYNATAPNFQVFYTRPHIEPRPHYVAQAGLNFAVIFLPQLPECWCYRCEPPCLLDRNTEIQRIKDLCQGNRARRRAGEPLLSPVSSSPLSLGDRCVPHFHPHLLSLPCLPPGAREGCGTGPGAGGPAGASAARAGSGSLGAPGVPSRTGEPAPEVGTVAGDREGQGSKDWVFKVFPGRYQGLEQRLEAELQAATTSKEEALMELKARALKLEEELIQVRLSWELRCQPLAPTWEWTTRAARTQVLSLNWWLAAYLMCWWGCFLHSLSGWSLLG